MAKLVQCSYLHRFGLKIYRLITQIIWSLHYSYSIYLGTSLDNTHLTSTLGQGVIRKCIEK